VAVAVRTLVWVRERVRLAVAVELSVVPVRPVLVAVVRVPLCGVAVTRMAVPRGMWLAVRATGTGFVVPVGRTMSGAARRLPVGLAGAAIPPTLVMARLGWPAGGKTGWGSAAVASGVVPPVKVRVVASRRMRPCPPL
jgi:hypothetical protein